MLRYLIRRLFVMIPTLVAISLLIFVIIQAPPGSFLDTYMAELQSQGENVDQGRIEFLPVGEVRVKACLFKRRDFRFRECRSGRGIEAG